MFDKVIILRDKSSSFCPRRPYPGTGFQYILRIIVDIGRMYVTATLLSHRIPTAARRGISTSNRHVIGARDCFGRPGAQEFRGYERGYGNRNRSPGPSSYYCRTDIAPIKNDKSNVGTDTRNYIVRQVSLTAIRNRI